MPGTALSLLYILSNLVFRATELARWVLLRLVAPLYWWEDWVFKRLVSPLPTVMGMISAGTGIWREDCLAPPLQRPPYLRIVVIFPFCFISLKKPQWRGLSLRAVRVGTEAQFHCVLGVWPWAFPDLSVPSWKIGIVTGLASLVSWKD